MPLLIKFVLGKMENPLNYYIKERVYNIDTKKAHFINKGLERAYRNHLTKEISLNCKSISIVQISLVIFNFYIETILNGLFSSYFSKLLLAIEFYFMISLFKTIQPTKKRATLKLSSDYITNLNRYLLISHIIR